MAAGLSLLINLLPPKYWNIEAIVWVLTLSKAWDPHKNFMMQLLFFFPFYRWGNRLSQGHSLIQEVVNPGFELRSHWVHRPFLATSLCCLYPVATSDYSPALISHSFAQNISVLLIICGEKSKCSRIIFKVFITQPYFTWLLVVYLGFPLWQFKGRRICHPQICHFGMWITLSWRQSRSVVD